MKSYLLALSCLAISTVAAAAETDSDDILEENLSRIEADADELTDESNRRKKPRTQTTRTSGNRTVNTKTRRATGGDRSTRSATQTGTRTTSRGDQVITQKGTRSVTQGAARSSAPTRHRSTPTPPRHPSSHSKATRIAPTTRPHRVTVHRVRPTHGIFVYGPRPVHQPNYVGVASPTVPTTHLPTRKVDRAGSFALGLRGGSYVSGYQDSDLYSDLGFGLAGRYRPTEFFGVELAVNYHDDSFPSQSARAQWVTQGSAMLFAFPWARVSPYVLGGLTWNQSIIDDDLMLDGERVAIEGNGALFGPHAGLGVEFALGKHVALDLDVRYAGYLTNNSDDSVLPGALQTNAGLMVHF